MVQYTRFPDRIDRSRPGVRRGPQPATPEPETAAADVPAADPAPARGVAPAKASGLFGLPWPVLVLVLSIFMPFYFNIGPLRMSPSRLTLVVFALPVAFLWLSGRAGRIRAADIFFLLTCVWMTLSFIANGGMAMIQYSAISVIELFVPYLIARVYLRDAATFRALIKVLFVIAVILCVAAGYEAQTRVRPFTEIFRGVLPVFGAAVYDPRLGMNRAQTVFEHPILYGVTMAFLVTPVFLSTLYDRSPLRAAIQALPVLGATFFALSMGAYLGVMVQGALLAWDFVLRRQPKRWHILAGLFFLAYVVVDLFSNRTPVEVFISYLAFNPHTAYWRVLIFNYGIENVAAHPILGLGLGDWARPRFMYTASVDNFWLLMAMRHGIPGFLLIFAGYIAVLTTLIRAQPAERLAQFQRKAMVFSLIGIGLALCTVHVWTASFVFFMFMLGAGVWVADAPQGAPGKTLRGGRVSAPAASRAPRQGRTAAGPTSAARRSANPS